MRSSVDFDELFARACIEILGVKTIPTECLPADREAFQHWEETGQLPNGWADGWLALLRATIHRPGGVPVRRLVLLPDTDTTYVRFVLAALELNAAAGEDVRVDWAGEQPSHGANAWMLDRRTVVELHADGVTERRLCTADWFWVAVAETSPTLATHLARRT